MNYYGQELNAYKASCHTHSTVSDGSFPPELIINAYEKEGFDIVFMTDHAISQDVSKYPTTNMKVYSGIELHPNGPRDIPWHILALGVPHPFPGEYASGQEAVDKVNAAGGLAYVAHPAWCGYTSAEVMTLKNTAGIEVYNTSCRYIGKEFNMQLWDEMLDAGQYTTALATDDAHNFHDLYRAWTVICAKENTLPAIMEALRNGTYYASTGPEIHSLSFENGIFKAEFSPCESAVLVGKRSRGRLGCVPGDPHPHSYKLVTSAEFDTTGLQENSFVRLQIRDAKGGYAWSQPVQLKK